MENERLRQWFLASWMYRIGKDKTVKYIRLYNGLTYEKAMLKARKIQADEAKLRKLGGTGNYGGVTIKLTFDGPGRKEYGVFVAPFALSPEAPSDYYV